MANLSINEHQDVSRFCIRTPRQLAERVVKVGSTEHVIEGLLPKQSLSLLIGDSGLGKSPFLYQAATALAAGIPFLGRTTRRGRVLYLDCENGLADVDGIVSQVSAFLSVCPPDDLRLWNLNDSDAGTPLDSLIKEVAPTWVIIDPLKAFFPDIERASGDAIKAYQQLRHLMQSYQCSITGVHHLRKPSQRPDESPASLAEANFREWFYQARGPRELINGCDVRFGVDLPRFAGDHTKLLFRGFGRVRGDTSLMRLVRVLDDDGEPQGFRQLCGIELLNSADQQAAYNRLPDQFRFKEAITAYGRGDQATTDFLSNCITAGILRKLEGRRGYEKISLSAEPVPRAVPRMASLAHDAGVAGATALDGPISSMIQ